MAVVKANAYGHGMVEIAQTALDAGADWLGVFSVREGLALRHGGLDAPVLILGPTPAERLAQAIAADLRLTVASAQSVSELLQCGPFANAVRCHVKLETGTNRQGLTANQLVDCVSRLQSAGIAVEGAYTHFADIEDTTDHSYATSQLNRFSTMLSLLSENGCPLPMAHTACTAAAILFPKTHFDMIRVGIGLYGLWPSKETRVSAGLLGRGQPELRPVMTWKTRIRQVKDVPAGEYVGYGRTYRTTRATRVAVLPVGYADGYDRSFSGRAHVLIRGTRAPILGRICMNLCMADVTDIPAAVPGDEAVLLGRSGDETVHASDLAAIANTINYEIVTRAAPGAPRVLMSDLPAGET
jgi:alanine racemase